MYFTYCLICDVYKRQNLIIINIKNKIKNRGSIYKLNNADFLGHIDIPILWIVLLSYIYILYFDFKQKNQLF